MYDLDKKIVHYRYIVFIIAYYITILSSWTGWKGRSLILQP